MCLAFLALGVHARYPLLIAANRDERHARATQAAQWWDNGILAGRDGAAGGTWLGISRAGRWALVTNVRDAGHADPAAPSRGALVVDALLDPRPPLSTAAATLRAGRRNGYNLLVGGGPAAAYASNRASGAVEVEPGLHGLSNQLLDADWPKVARGKLAVASVLAESEPRLESIFALLADAEPAPEAALPSTGVSSEWETLLSSAFIVSPAYGTRSSTVITVSREGAVRFIERSFDAQGATSGEIDHAFELAD